MGYPPSSSGTPHVRLISSVTESSSGADIRLDSSMTGRPGGDETPEKAIFNQTIVVSNQ